MSIFGLILTGLLAGAQVPQRVSAEIDISYLSKTQSKTATLSYAGLVDRVRQVRLQDVFLTIDGQNYYPIVHISAYLDEIAGTEICKIFGYGRGVLGASVKSAGYSTFSMNSYGQVEGLTETNGDDGDDRVAGEVICSVPGSVQ